MQEIRMCYRRPDRVVCHRTHPLLQGGRLEEWQELTKVRAEAARYRLYHSHSVKYTVVAIHLACVLCLACITH